jgi:pimeloyl-ACP methyl ester carboxylesterase
VQPRSALSTRRQPGLHAGGDGSLHRGVVATRRGICDDQLLPVLGADLAKTRRSPASPNQGAHIDHLGARRSLPGQELAEPEHEDVPNLDRVERLPDASHWVHHDQAERVNQLLIDFFAPALPTKNS